MQFKTGGIEGVIVKELIKYSDERGFLVEAIRIDNFSEKLGLVMSYVSYTKPSMTRGPHEHMEQ